MLLDDVQAQRAVTVHLRYRTPGRQAAAKGSGQAAKQDGERWGWAGEPAAKGHALLRAACAASRPAPGQSALTHVGVEHFAGEPHTGRLVWVLFAEGNAQLKDSALRGAPGCSVVSKMGQACAALVLNPRTCHKRSRRQRTFHGVSTGPRMEAPHTYKLSSLSGDALQPSGGSTYTVQGRQRR